MRRRRLIITKREPAIISVRAAWNRLGREVALVEFDWPRYPAT